MSFSQGYYVLDGSGNSVISTSNGTYYTALMSTIDSTNTQVYLEFFSDSAGTIPVTPTAGSVTVEASPMGNVWLTSGNSPTISAATVSYPSGSYSAPNFYGKINQGRITFSGIAGAAYARVLFWRYQ